MNTPAGYIISWRVPATVGTDRLRQSLLAAGLSADLAPDLKPVQVVARSAGVLAKATSTQDVKRLARPIHHSARQITREETVQDDLTYTREAAIRIDEHTQQITCDDPKLAAELLAVIQLVHDTRTASDVTRIVQRIVEEAGSDLMPVRDQGGAYFVPAGHTVMHRVATFLEGVEGDLSQFACTLGHGSDESIANTITDYLLKQVDELQASIDELNENGIRANVKARRMMRVAAIRDRISAYSTLIQAQGSKLVQALDKAEASLLQKIGPERGAAA
jgi:hypothetical protein